MLSALTKILDMTWRLAIVAIVFLLAVPIIFGILSFCVSASTLYFLAYMPQWLLALAAVFLTLPLLRIVIKLL